MKNINEEAIVYIIDDNEGVTESLRWLIESVGYVVKVYNNPKLFLGEFNPDRISCVVVDVRMPELSGPELQEALLERHTETPLIFITGHADVPVAVRAMKLGAVDFLTKPTNSQVLLETINKAIRMDIKRRQKREQNAEVIIREKRLSPREREVMRLIVSGKLTKSIADKLGLSLRTVEMHRANIMKKMEVNSQVELTSVILRNGLISEDQLAEVA